jgi:hypothetical protein
MEAEKQLGKQLQPYCWKPGQSGNPNGRPPGKSLKTFVREYLESLPDEDKLEYLKSIPAELAWKMAEGNPANNTDITSGGKPIPILGGITNDISKDISSE